MDTTEIIAQGLISLLTFFLGALVAAAQQHFSRKRSLLKEKYSELYRPFIRLIQMDYQLDAYSFTEADIEKQSEIITLLRDKDYLAPKEVQFVIYNFLMCTSHMLGDDPEFIKIKDDNFSNLCIIMMKEYKQISRKLNYSTPTYIDNLDDLNEDI